MRRREISAVETNAFGFVILGLDSCIQGRVIIHREQRLDARLVAAPGRGMTRRQGGWLTARAGISSIRRVARILPSYCPNRAIMDRDGDSFSCSAGLRVRGARRHGLGLRARTRLTPRPGREIRRAGVA